MVGFSRSSSYAFPPSTCALIQPTVLAGNVSRYVPFIGPATSACFFSKSLYTLFSVSTSISSTAFPSWKSRVENDFRSCNFKSAGSPIVAIVRYCFGIRFSEAVMAMSSSAFLSFSKSGVPE